MLVKALRVGPDLAWLRVGARNVRRYFPRHIPAIELQLDHLRIECGLSSSFWRGQPEIRDPRLGLWLKARHFAKGPNGKPILLAMVPSGENSFRLEPAAHSGNRA